jgi:hypothetical protein
MLNIYPDNMSLNIVVPLGVGRTLTVFEWYRHEGASKEEIERTIRFCDEIQIEDIAVCEAVQRAASRPAPRGASRRRERTACTTSRCSTSTAWSDLAVCGSPFRSVGAFLFRPVRSRTVRRTAISSHRRELPWELNPQERSRGTTSRMSVQSSRIADF